MTNNHHVQWSSFFWHFEDAFCWETIAVSGLFHVRELVSKRGPEQLPVAEAPVTLHKFHARHKFGKSSLSEDCWAVSF